ncbi:glycosyl transferase family 1 [Halioglobus sp. HI00S01]|nr:glycosyl transferase family 1 [Halioglobus sp. HI00S01]
MKVMLFANTDWYLYNFRLSLAAEIKRQGFDLVLVSPNGEYGPKLRELGYEWIAAPMDRTSLNPLRELALLWWLKRLIQLEGVTLIHGFTIKCAVYGSLAARLAGDVARINAVAGLGYVFISNDIKARVLRPMVRGMMRFALGGDRARLILQNPDDVDMFVRTRLVREEIIRLIPGSGVDCERFKPNQRSRTNNPPRVLLPARLLWDKGLAEYASAAREIIADGYQAVFLLAGEPDPGNPASVSRRDIDKWVGEGILEWLGHVDDMPTLFCSVDVVVLPSYREGLPKGLIEASACGLPLVTTDVPGCRHVVENGINGYLVQPQSSQMLAIAIKNLLDNSSLRQRLGIAARRKALMEFDERIVLSETVSTYGEVA